MMPDPIHPPARAKSIARRLIAVLAAAACLAVVPAIAADPGGASLTVTFHGLSSGKGAVMVSLAADPAGFEGKAAPASQARIVVAGDTASATFTGLAPGAYAIRAFHDLVGDGKLKTNPFGIPTEPFAFSNNARGVMGPPSWPQAAFAIKAGANTQSINLD